MRHYSVADIPTRYFDILLFGFDVKIRSKKLTNIPIELHTKYLSNFHFKYISNPDQFVWSGRWVSALQIIFRLGPVQIVHFLPAALNAVEGLRH
jgi:hypothetical protein